MLELKKILLTLTRYLQLDLHYFFVNGFYSLLQQLVGISCGLGVSYLYGHFVDKNIYGEYNLVMSVVSLVTFLSFPGIDSALLRAVGSGADGTYPYAVKKKITFSFLGSLVILLLSFYYFLTGHTSIFQSLLIVAVVYPFLYAFQLSSQYLSGKKNFKLLSILGVLSSTVFLTSTAIFVYMKPSTIGLVVSYLIGIIIPSLISYLYTRNLVPKNALINKTVISYGTFLTYVSVIPWIGSYLGNIILAATSGNINLAIFSVANDLFSNIHKNFVVLFKPASAKLAQMNETKYLATIHQHFLKFLGMGICLSGAMYVAAPIFISIFFPRYPEAISLAQLLSISLIPIPLTYALTDSILFLRKKRPHLILSTWPQFIKIMLYIVLIPQYKLLGIVYISIIDRFLYASIAYYLLRRSV